MCSFAYVCVLASICVYLLMCVPLLFVYVVRICVFFSLDQIVTVDSAVVKTQHQNTKNILTTVRTQQK